MVLTLVMLMVYPRTATLKRRFSRYLSRFPELFIGRLDAVYLVKNSGKGIALVLSEMEKEQGNIEVFLSEPLRIEQIIVDENVKETASWLKEKNGLKILEDEIEDLPKDKAEIVESLSKKRFSVQLNLR